MTKRFRWEDLTNDDQTKLLSVICCMADLFTAPDVNTKERFASLSKDWVDWCDKNHLPRPFKLGVKLVRAYMLTVYGLCLPKDKGLPKRFYPPAEKLLARKHPLARQAGRTIKWSAENRAVMEDRDRRRCTCGASSCPVHVK